MRKILLFCKYDWLDRRAGPIEQYIYEVFRRIAGEGNLVTWVAHRPLARETRRRPRIENVENVQMVRLGYAPFYRFMMGLFLSRLAVTGKIAQQYDVIVDCVAGKPLEIDKHTQLPVLPIVFHLDRGLRAIEDLAGPLIAVNERACGELCDSGVPPKAIVRAAFGVDMPRFCGETPETPKQRMVVAAENTRLARRAAGLLRAEGIKPELIQLPRRALGRGPDWRVPPLAGEPIRAENYRGAALGICGEGFERESLSMAARGITAVCPATILGQEYVRHDETGLLYEPGNAGQLAACMKRLLTEDGLLDRLSANAREDAQNRSWEKTARLVLATLENM